MQLVCPAGENLLQYIRKKNIRIPALCAGNGRCGNCRVRIGMSVVDSRDVGSAARYDSRYINKLSRLILKRDLQRGVAAARYQTSGNDSRKDVYIYIASRHKANHLFAFYRDLSEHHCCHGYGASTLSNEFLLLYQRQYSCCDLIFCDCDHIINILFYE